jgi:hypothetical protein
MSIAPASSPPEKKDWCKAVIEGLQEAVAHVSVANWTKQDRFVLFYF